MFISRSIVEEMADFFGTDSLSGLALRKAVRLGGDCIFFLDGNGYFVMPRPVAA